MAEILSPFRAVCKFSEYSTVAPLIILDMENYT